MKKSFITLIFMSMYMNILLAQNFNIVTQGRDYFYTNGFQTFAIRADSISVPGSDTMYHHFSMFRDTASVFQSDVCVDVFGGSLFGKTNLMLENGHFVILTNKNDSVILLPNAQLNDTWILYKWITGFYIEATVSHIGTQTVLGQTSTVKTISLSVKDYYDNPVISHPFHMKQLKLSENFGLIQTFDFYLFPLDTTLYVLEGITNPEHGYIMSPRTVFDFDLGDEFHYSEKSIVFYGWYPQQIWQGYTQLTMKTVLGKSFSAPDTAVTYEYQVCSRLITYHQLIPDTIFSVDTISETIVFHNPADSTFHQLPGQTFEHTNFQFLYDCPIIEQYNHNNQRIRLYYDRTDVAFNIYTDSCWQWLMVDPAPGVFRYFDGLGGPYYFIDSWSMAIPIQERKLLYYKKGAETWGTPIGPSCESLINSISEINVYHLNIFPNPATDYIIIDIEGYSGATEIVMFDMSGRIVLQSQYKKEISVKSLPVGMYIIHVYNSAGQKYSGKVVVNF
jgi:hypothetical protein